MNHVLLADLARALHRQQRPAQAPLLRHALGDGRLRDEQRRADDEAAAEGAGERGGGEWAKLAALRERMEAEGADGGEGGEEPGGAK